MTTTRSRRRGSIARDVPVEYARAPIAVIVVAHMGANAVFLPNAKSADRADMMVRDKSTHDRGVTSRPSWGAWASGNAGWGGTTWGGGGRHDRSRLEVGIYPHDRDVLFFEKSQTWDSERQSMYERQTITRRAGVSE